MIGLNHYECFKNNNFKRKSIIVFGDSHSLPLLAAVLISVEIEEFIYTINMAYSIKYIEDINSNILIIFIDIFNIYYYILLSNYLKSNKYIHIN